MFNLFRKKTQVEKLIESDGIEYAAARFSEIIARKLPTRDIAFNFILQELDGASRGNKDSKIFASNSGIHPSQYKNSLSISSSEIDGPEGPQQLLLSLCLGLSKNQEAMAEFRCKIDENIMRKFELGKYEKKIYDEFDDLQSKVNNKINEIANLMLDAVNQNDIVLLDIIGASKISKETLHKISDEDLLLCKTKVICIFVLAHLADSAFNDDESTSAKYIVICCKPIATEIMKISQDHYSDMEFTMFDVAMDIMKKIESS